MTQEHSQQQASTKSSRSNPVRQNSEKSGCRCSRKCRRARSRTPWCVPRANDMLEMSERESSDVRRNQQPARKARAEVRRSSESKGKKGKNQRRKKKKKEKKKKEKQKVFGVFLHCVLCCLISWATRGLPADRAPVYRGCPCRDPLGCPLIARQDGIRDKAPTLWLLL